MCVPLGGRAHRPEPGRPPKAGLQAPSDYLRTRQPPGGRDNRGQRQRHHPLRAIGGRRAGDSWPARTAQAETEERLRRPGLSLAEVTEGTAPPRNQSQGRQAKRSARLWPRPQALGGRAHHLLASPVPPFTGALRATCRYPPGIPDDRLLPDLSQAASGGGVILKGALRSPCQNNGTKYPMICLQSAGNLPYSSLNCAAPSRVSRKPRSCSRMRQAAGKLPSISLPAAGRCGGPWLGGGGSGFLGARPRRTQRCWSCLDFHPAHSHGMGAALLESRPIHGWLSGELPKPSVHSLDRRCAPAERRDSDDPLGASLTHI
jgi:hypothetical protein